jgi:hypothetical protein
MTTSFMGRFILLGLLISIPLAVVGIMAAILAVSFATENGSHHVSRIGLILPSIIATLLLDIALTFVVPALALSTTSIGEALSLGCKMIRVTWPSSKWYALAPGLTATLLAGLLPSSAAGPWLPILIGGVGTFLGLWFKGATVAFYARAFPSTPDDGSSRAG